MIRLLIIFLFCACSNKTWDGKYFWENPSKFKASHHRHKPKVKDINTPNYIPKGPKQHEIIMRYYYMYHYYGKGMKFKKEK